MAGGGACVCIFSQFVLVVFPVNSIATTANELLAKSAACSQEMRKRFFTNGPPTDPQDFCDTCVLLLILDSVLNSLYFNETRPNSIRMLYLC